MATANMKTIDSSNIRANTRHETSQPKVSEASTAHTIPGTIHSRRQKGISQDRIHQQCKVLWQECGKAVALIDNAQKYDAGCGRVRLGYPLANPNGGGRERKRRPLAHFFPWPCMGDARATYRQPNLFLLFLFRERNNTNSPTLSLENGPRMDSRRFFVFLAGEIGPRGLPRFGERQQAIQATCCSHLFVAEHAAVVENGPGKHEAVLEVREGLQGRAKAVPAAREIVAKSRS